MSTVEAAAIGITISVGIFSAAIYAVAQIIVTAWAANQQLSRDMAAMEAARHRDMTISEAEKDREITRELHEIAEKEERGY